jgi:transposase
MSRYVGIDLHRRRSVVVIIEEDGAKASSVRIDNAPLRLVEAVEAAGPGAEVVLEATWGWYWAVDVLAGAGCRVHLAHPLGIKGFEHRRVKNDDRDVTLLAELLRMGNLPESWIAPHDIRRVGELVRFRAQAVSTPFRSHVPSACGVGQRRKAA